MGGDRVGKEAKVCDGSDYTCVGIPFSLSLSLSLLYSLCIPTNYTLPTCSVSLCLCLQHPFLDVPESELLRDIVFVFQNIEGEHIHYNRGQDAFRLDEKVPAAHIVIA